MKQAVARNSVGFTIAALAVFLVMSVIGWSNQVERAVKATPEIEVLQGQIIDIEKQLREIGDEEKKTY